jgi:DNA transposition AAA+ family ATPase
MSLNIIKKPTKRVAFIETAGIQKSMRNIDRRIRNGRSVMLSADFGAGKSTLLRNIVTQYEEVDLKIISGIGTATQVIGEIAGEADVKPWEKQRYIGQIRLYPRLVLIDEAHHLPRGIFPHLKDFIEHGSVFVLAGLPKLAENMINTKNSDLLSRFLQISFERVGIKEISEALPMFEYNALRLLNSNAESSRALFEAIEDCMEYIEQEGLAKVTEDLALSIWNGDV